MVGSNIHFTSYVPGPPRAESKLYRIISTCLCALSLVLDVDNIRFWVEQSFSDTPLKVLGAPGSE